MRLFHYSNKTIKTMREESQNVTVVPGKPNGLWLSVGDSHPRWWERESDPETDRLKVPHIYEVVLKYPNTVLVLRNAEQLRAFTKSFGFEQFNSSYIDWKRVAEKYDGIVITPYVHECRFELHWYYGWDYASGCVWHPRAVARLTEVSESDVPSYKQQEA